MKIKAICIICTERFQSAAVMSVCPCGHVFHSHCIEQWFEKSKQDTCPQCRQLVNPVRLVNPLYLTEDDEDEDEEEKRMLRETVHQMQQQQERMRLQLNSKTEKVHY
jgi:hypothetical protein